MGRQRPYYDAGAARKIRELNKLSEDVKRIISQLPEECWKINGSADIKAVDDETLENLEFYIPGLGILIKGDKNGR